jgi:hypothetical protein
LRGFKKLLFREQNRAARLATEKLGSPSRPAARVFVERKKIEASCGFKGYHFAEGELLAVVLDNSAALAEITVTR